MVVHGHFYQPPRENPWTDEIPRQPSAAPFHDWNERVTAEAYRPNGAARMVDDRDRVVSIVNNYGQISFDVGPTLLAWLERHDPTTYGRILSGDRHGGGAIAQAFGHLILPLAAERDIRTQVKWGLADFEFRFGRQARGMWLPETAVNDAVLTVLVEEGVGFTILAPDQAARVRRFSELGEEWRDATAADVAGHVYRWLHPGGDGRGIDILFYDGSLSHSVAFEMSTLSSQALVDRIERIRTPLALVAADGETFGHHHTYGDRLLAYALAVEAPRRGLRVTTAAAYVEAAEPEGFCEVRESAWSCAHGVGRWHTDCGCSTGGEEGWNQQWRGPLRAALNLVRDALDEAFERRGKRTMEDPWAARDDYVRVCIGAESVADFAGRHISGDPVEALTLLEAQRHAMSMYTSCGWFFNDLAGIETVQVLRYAARVVDLLVELDEPDPTDAFLERLAEAKSNNAAEGDGREIWERQVIPVRVDAERVVAHLALADLLEDVPPGAPTACHEIEVLERERLHRGLLRLVTGTVALTHQRTLRRTEHLYAALHLGGLEILGVTRAPRSGDGEVVAALREEFLSGNPVTALVRSLGALGGREFNLSAALPDHIEEILESAAESLAERFATAYDRLFDDHRATLEALSAAGYPLPPVLRAPAELSLARRLEAEVAAQAGSVDPAAYAGALAVAREARSAGVRIDTPSARAVAERLLANAVARTVDDPEHAEDSLAIAVGLLGLAAALELHPNLQPAQELVYEALLHQPTPALRTLGARLGLAVERIGRPD